MNKDQETTPEVLDSSQPFITKHQTQCMTLKFTLYLHPVQTTDIEITFCRAKSMLLMQSIKQRPPSSKKIPKSFKVSQFYFQVPLSTSARIKAILQTPSQNPYDFILSNIGLKVREKCQIPIAKRHIIQTSQPTQSLIQSPSCDQNNT